ncbi:MAG: DUF935 family protein [Sumerlaeia bacterium]
MNTPEITPPNPGTPNHANAPAPLASQARRWMRLDAFSSPFNQAFETQKREQDLLATEASNGRYQRSLYELFSEMEEKDGQLYSLLQTRINALVGLDYNWEFTGEATLPTPQQDAVRSFIQSALTQFPRFKEFIKALLDALAKGFSAVELIWGYNEKGQWVVQDWRAHPQEYFAFSNTEGSCLALKLLSPPFEESRDRDTVLKNSTTPEQTTTTANNTVTRLGAWGKAVPAPERKFVVLHFGRDARNPFGRGLCQRAYWYYWFKKNTLRSWAIYNEKYGAPLAVAQVNPTLPNDEREKLLQILDSLQTDAGIVIPETIKLEYLEASKNGDGECFKAMADWCNDEMARIVLGATLSTGEGRRSGSMALGRVHESVRQDYIEADSRLLESTLNETLIRWLVELNFLPGTKGPTLKFDVTLPEDLETQIRVDGELLRLGLPIGTKELYRRYGRTEPSEQEHRLSHDDSNIFQYHLRFGILTINEVRKRLQLPPVAWGERPTSEVLLREREGSAVTTTGGTDSLGERERGGERTENVESTSNELSAEQESGER